MMRIDSGTLVSKARETEYSVLGDVLARRTFDESGNYTVKPFLFDTRESINNTVKGIDFTGVYSSGAQQMMVELHLMIYLHYLVLMVKHMLEDMNLKN